ncbi:MAG: sigma-70 family RNA polymerase sigma factor [Desulfotomaculum sp.]|nr:sigma-70 family RNA polymerase sigma factor [Desulfotomaculum sp.]MCL0080700.1 sigma-70 family RNA polymerase sigma factor [Peptococcaceae bacterium]
MSPTDQQLINKSKAGDYLAFEELVRKYENKVYNIAYRFMGNHADACDLAQEAFIKAYQSLAKFRGDAGFVTWMYHITANVCRDELRRRKNKQTVSLDETFSDNAAPVFNIASVAPGPAEELERQELCGQVQDCLNTLSDEYRLVLIMREMQGLSYDEIAVTLDCSLGTVKSRLNRARISFKKKMKVLLELSTPESRQYK